MHKHSIKLIALFAVFILICSGCVSSKFELPSFEPSDNITTSSPTANIDISSNATVPDKIYPTVHNDVELLTKNTDNILSEKDIKIISGYIDVWASAYDTRGNGFRADEATAFASDESIATVNNNIANGTFDYSVTGTQVLSIVPMDDGYIEVIYIIGLDGCDTANGITEGQYESVNAIRLTKENGKFSLSGIAFLIMAERDTLVYELDTIANRYTITALGDYIS